MGLLCAAILYPVVSTTKRHKIIMWIVRISMIPLVVVLYVVLMRNFYKDNPFAGKSGFYLPPYSFVLAHFLSCCFLCFRANVNVQLTGVSPSPFARVLPMTRTRVCTACSWCRYLSCIPTSSNNKCQGYVHYIFSILTLTTYCLVDFPPFLRSWCPLPKMCLPLSTFIACCDL